MAIFIDPKIAKLANEHTCFKVAVRNFHARITIVALLMVITNI